MRSALLRTAGSAAIGAGTVLAAGAIVIPFHEVGPQAGHMAAHIASMNVVAPLLAAVVASRRRLPDLRPALLWAATLGQIVLIWAFHAPAIHAVATSHPWLQLGMHAVLLTAALLFWISVLTLSGKPRWQAVPALLVTGKLTCLLAALLVFAPRVLYGAGHAPHAALDDQHLAGLLMIAACPLGYLVPAVVITVQLINDGTTGRRSLRTAA
jgi:putative membrane protein